MATITSTITIMVQSIVCSSMEGHRDRPCIAYVARRWLFPKMRGTFGGTKPGWAQYAKPEPPIAMSAMTASTPVATKPTMPPTAPVPTPT